MTTVWILWILSSFSFITLTIQFAFVFGAIPGDWYKYGWNVAKIFTICSFIEFVASLAAFILAATSPTFGYTVGDLEVRGIMLFFYICLVGMSMYWIFVSRKDKSKVPDKIIELRADEYEIKSEQNFILPFMVASVDSLAVADNCTIVFPGTKPTTETDARFICRVLDEENNVYVCIAFVDFADRHSIKYIFNSFVNLTVVFAFMSLPIFAAYCQYTGASAEELLVGPITYSLGVGVNKLCAKLRGFSRIIYYFTYLLIVVGIIEILQALF